jgi:prephenate dehydrogenase
MRIAVLGVGLIGGSIGLAARGRLECAVTGFDPDRATVDRAVESGAVDRGVISITEACEGADVVFCAAPVAGLTELASAALEACGPDTVVTDVGSTKRDIVAALGSDERFIGGHPLAGAETSGVENARADLFEGARWYLTPKSERSSGMLYDRLQRTVAGLGARVQAIDAETHDRLMATVSHLPHVVANVLVAQAAAELTRDSERMPEVGPSFRDTTRVAGANPAIWGDIFASNREAVAEAVEAVALRLGEAAELIRDGERGSRRRQAPAAGDRAQRRGAARVAGGCLQSARHHRRAGVGAR